MGTGAPRPLAGGKRPFAGYAPDSHAQAAPVRPLCAWEAPGHRVDAGKAEVANQRAWSGMKLSRRKTACFSACTALA